MAIPEKLFALALEKRQTFYKGSEPHIVSKIDMTKKIVTIVLIDSKGKKITVKKLDLQNKYTLVPKKK
jgi:hypothetical protein